MMAAELAKSDFAHNTLKESTEALAQLSDNYSSLDTMLSSSRALLGTLLKSQKTDTWYLQSAFYLLAVTVGWLIFRRLLWGPTWWLVWLPLKLLFRTTVGISRVVGLHGSQVQSALESSSTHTNPQQQAYMNNENVPTIQVGTPPVESQTAEEDDTMLDKVGKIIDESQVVGKEELISEKVVDEFQNEIPATEAAAKFEEETMLRDREEGELPNPKKRMMEAEGEGPMTGDERIRDEL